MFLYSAKTEQTDDRSFHFYVGVLCSVLILLFSSLCPSSVAIILLGKKELVVLLLLLPDVL